MRRRPLLALTVLALVAAACSDDSSPQVVGTASANTADTATGSTDGSTDGSTAVGDEAFGWQDFGDTGRVQTGSLTVPIDHDDPSKGTFDLYVARHLADPSKRIGSLLVNPGGPGFGGSDFAVYADQVYSETLLDHFDIIGWDPRGTGLSEPHLDCVDDLERFYAGTDITPDDQAERDQLIDLAKEFEAGCEERSGDILPYVTTNASARDMDAIRQALGEDTISYFGFSYGSELGATWATLFPDTVRAAVLDGAVDPTLSLSESGLSQAAGFEGTLDTFLAQCSDDDGCAFHSDGDAEGAFDQLMQSIDDRPIPTVDGRPELTRNMAITGVAMAMYDESYWPELAQALTDARDGDGSGLLSLYDAYLQRADDGTYDNSLEAFQVISCMDSEERPTVAEEDAGAADARAVAPRLSPATVGSYFCTFFPATTDPRVTITGKGAGPILVVGTTGDPATPLDGTRKMALALEGGRLLIVTAEQHTGYDVNQCSRDAVDQYLLDPVNNLPADGTTC